MSVADPNGDWELEVHMPEDRIGHVALAEKDIRPDLPVRFILRTSPGVEHEGVVKEVQRTPRSAPRRETPFSCG